MLDKPPLGRMSAMAAIFACIALVIGCSQTGADASKTGGSGSPGGPGKEPPAPVTATEVEQKSLPIELRAFGTVEPNASVDVKSQITGELIGVHFEKGQEVKTGDLLFTIDSRPARAEKRLAEANLSRDKVQYENAKLEAERQKKLFEKKLVSEQQYEKARTAAAALAATVSAGSAAIQSASLTVKFSEIRSPIDGRTGDLLVHLGNLVKANDAVLVTVKQIRPIRVAFSLPQKELPAVMRRINGAAGTGGALEARAFIPGEEETPENGRVALIDNAVDPATGTIKVWAEFENAASRLWPGQLVNVVLTLAIQDNAIVVPLRAVQNGQNGSYVFVIGKDNVAEQRPITAERTQGDDTIVSQGLKPGERIVTDGQLRLKPGSVVSIRAEAAGGATKP